MSEKKIIEQLQKQRKLLLKEPLAWVVCVCGRRLALKMAFRCWFCGLCFCAICARKHYGDKPLIRHV